MKRLLLLACLLAGCAKPVPPPVQPVTAQSQFFRIAPTNLVFLKWPDGPTVLIWADIDGPAGGGTGPCPAGVAYSWSHREVITKTEVVEIVYPPGMPRPPQPPRPPGPPATKTSQVETGRGVSWRVETADGVTGAVTIGMERFDLAKGNVFLVTTSGAGKVTQLTRDLSGVEIKHESFAELAKSDDDIRTFVESAAPSK